MSIIDTTINLIETELEKLRSTQPSAAAPEPVSQNPAPLTDLERELAKTLSDMIPPFYDRTHPYAATWDAAHVVLGKVWARL
jgi:hypothetical protein